MLKFLSCLFRLQISLDVKDLQVFASEIPDTKREFEKISNSHRPRTELSYISIRDERQFISGVNIRV